VIGRPCQVPVGGDRLRYPAFDSRQALSHEKPEPLPRSALKRSRAKGGCGPRWAPDSVGDEHLIRPVRQCQHQTLSQVCGHKIIWHILREYRTTSASTSGESSGELLARPEGLRLRWPLQRSTGRLPDQSNSLTTLAFACWNGTQYSLSQGSVEETAGSHPNRDGTSRCGNRNLQVVTVLALPT
jgi:hypothetical protein